MILDLAIIDIKAESSVAFEAALEQVSPLFDRAKGHLRHQFKKCIEQENRYIFLVEWETVEDHTIGFAKSELGKELFALIGKYVEKPALIQHYQDY